MDLQEKVGMKIGMEAGTEVHVKAGMKVVVEAGAQISLKVGGNFIDINPAGIFIKGNLVMINSGGSAGSGSGCSPDAAVLPQEAEKEKSGEVATSSASTIDKSPVSLGSTTVKAFSNPQAQSLANASKDGTPYCAKCEAAKLAAARK